MDLKGKVALVTGGGVRVGRAISLGLAGAGAHVVVNYHSSAAAAQETAADARGLGVEALAVQADLSQVEAARSLARAAKERFGRVDVLVHAASPFMAGGLFEADAQTWQHISGVLVQSLVVLAQELVPDMQAAGAGAIVAILDRGSFEPWPDHLLHGVGKAALWALVRSLAVALAPQVRVNAIVPGPVLPPPGRTAQQLAGIARSTLLERWGSPQDIVEAALYLVHADYITGEAIFVDGGERWAHRRSGR